MIAMKAMKNLIMDIVRYQDPWPIQDQSPTTPTTPFQSSSKTSNSTLSSSETSNTISPFSKTSNQSLRPLTTFQFLLLHFSSLALHFWFHIPVSVSSFPFLIYCTVFRILVSTLKSLLGAQSLTLELLSPRQSKWSEGCWLQLMCCALPKHLCP